MFERTAVAQVVLNVLHTIFERQTTPSCNIVVKESLDESDAVVRDEEECPDVQPAALSNCNVAWWISALGRSPVQGRQSCMRMLKSCFDTGVDSSVHAECAQCVLPTA